MDSGGVATKTKRESPLFLFPRPHSKGLRKGAFMIDIKARLSSLQNDFNNEYTSLADVYETLKSTDINLTYSEISEYLLSELDNLNPRGIEHFISDDIYQWINLHGLPAFKRKNNQAIKLRDHINLFFEFIDLAAKNKITSISNFEYHFDVFGITRVKASEIFIEKRKIENALGCEIKITNKAKEPAQNIKLSHQPKQNHDELSSLVQQLTAKDEEILRLKEEIENLKKPELTKDETEQEQAKSSLIPQTAEAKVDNYNPKERETHLKLIYALTMARTNKDFSASVYFNSKGILKTSTMMNDLIRDFEESGIQGFSADSLRKKLAEILKIEDIQAE